MNDLELEPLPDDVLAALGDAPVPALPPGVAEAVLAKVKVSAGLAAATAVSNAASQGVSSTTTVATKAGVSVLVKVLPVLTLTAGIGLGVAADRFVLRPNSVTERLVVERVEVPTPVPAEPKPMVKTPPKKVAAVDTLGRERVLLDLARSALSSGDVAKALAAVQAHEAQFPSGQLTEEREALAVQILWTAGRRDEATRRLHAFSLQFADSPLRPSLDAMMR